MKFLASFFKMIASRLKALEVSQKGEQLLKQHKSNSPKHKEIKRDLNRVKSLNWRLGQISPKEYPKIKLKLGKAFKKLENQIKEAD